MSRRLVPSAATVPRVGRTNPLTTLKNVVLPAPLGPTSPHTPPGSSNDTPSSGLNPPNATVRSCTRSIRALPSSTAAPPQPRQRLELAGDALRGRADGMDETDPEHHEDQVAVDADV